MFPKMLLVLLVVDFLPDFSCGQTETKYFRDDYHYIEAVESFYKLHMAEQNLADAIKVCALEGTTLYYPENKAEADAVLEFWKRTDNSGGNLLLGLTDSKIEGQFETIDGKPISEVYVNWLPKEPNDERGTEDCVELYPGGGFNDESCERKYRFICKKTLKSIVFDYSCKITDFDFLDPADKKFFRKDYKYLEGVDSFYKIHTTPTNWRDAKLACAEEGASLFYPENSDEVDAVIPFWKQCQKYTRPSDVWVFVGISDIITEGTLETVDGKSISEVYNHWKINQPDNSGDEDCVRLNQEGKLDDVKCDAKYSFICKKRSPERGCIHKPNFSGHKDKFFRDDYSYIEEVESFYKIHTTPQAFADAKRMCALEGASLFYAENDDEAHAVIEFWNKTYPSGGWTVYVGLTDIINEGAFETIDGKPISDVYNNWRLREPNSHNGEEDCVELYRQGYLNDKSCDVKFRFICKKSFKTLEWNHNCNMSDLDYIFVKNINKCYKLHTTPLSWMEAQAVCHAEQSYLAVVNNQVEADYLAKITKTEPKRKVGGGYQKGIYHLGFHNNFNKGWETVKGTPINIDNNAWWDACALTDDEKIKCGSMFYDGLLTTIDCDTKSFFICEHELK